MSLSGMKGLVVGIANEHSIAYGCAKAFHNAGADLAVTYLNAKAEPYVRPLAEATAKPDLGACDVREPGQLEAVFARSRRNGAAGLLAAFDCVCADGGSPQPRRRLFAVGICPGDGRLRATPSSAWRIWPSR